MMMVAIVVALCAILCWCIGVWSGSCAARQIIREHDQLLVANKELGKQQSAAVKKRDAAVAERDAANAAIDKVLEVIHDLRNQTT